MRPTLNVAHTPGPSSPPHTPTTTTPVFNQKNAANIRSSPHSKRAYHKIHGSNIHPLSGHHFSYTRGPRPEEISPRSSHSSEEDSDTSESPPQSPLSEIPELKKPPIAQVTTASIRIVEATFAIEEMSDPDSDDDHADILRPYGFEYPESDRSRSRSRPPDLDPAVMNGFEHMDPFETSDEETEDEETEDFERNRRMMREIRRLRRMKSGSISKRTVSERGSDSDREDVLPYYEGNEPGPNFRRMRRKTDRHNMQFSGQFPERIEELKEPNSDDEIILDDAELFAREMPYWALMDVDSE